MDTLSKTALGNENIEEYEKDAESEWNLSTINITPLEESSLLCYQQQTWNQLRLLQKEEMLTARPTIPATKCERLSYFRCYVSSSCKREIIGMQHIHFNNFFWNYMANIFGKSLPISYIYTILGGYAPDYHMFLPRMVPLSYGVIVIYLLAGILDIIVFSDNCILLLDYFICSLLHRNPWNRCDSNSSIIEKVRVNCYTLNNFAAKFENASHKFVNFSYVTSSDEHFQMAPILYYRTRFRLLTSNMHWKSYYMIYFIFILTLAALLHGHLFKVYLWRVLHRVHFFMITCYMLIYFHLLYSYLDMKYNNVPKIVTPVSDTARLLWEIDTDILAESMIAPPILHIITARSNAEVHPSRDTTLLIVSNALYYIFTGLISYNLKIYCDFTAKAPVFFTNLNPNPFFYLWPIYFSTFYLGNLCSDVFFLVKFVMEFLTLSITYQCLVEVIVCEWGCPMRWMVSIGLVLLAIVIASLFSYTSRYFIFIYTKTSITLIEIIVLYYMYPLGRLIDDITFHFGATPSMLWTINLKLAPFFFVIKYYRMTQVILLMVRTTQDNLYKKILQIYVSTLTLTAIFVISGIIYVFYKFKRNKKSWEQTCCPYPDWGPKDPKTKRLRKQYNSRDYIGSQAPRRLSRYMIRKAEPKVYGLDVWYESVKRRSYLGNETQD